MAIIQPYHTKPNFDPLGKSTFSQSFLGVELELESRIREDKILEELAQKTINELGDFVVLKQDASLSFGFEICSRPASLDTHKEKWSNFFANVAPNMVTSFIRSSDLKKIDSCGMHIHINRDPLSDLQIGKILSFVHEPTNYNFIKTIAGRDSNQYCKYAERRGFKDAKPEYYTKNPRSSGVNLHNNNTIEIRIFKATTDFYIFLKNLEFAHSLVKFTAPGLMSVKDVIQYKKFIEFVNVNKKIYPNLFKFMSSENSNMFRMKMEPMPPLPNFNFNPFGYTNNYVNVNI